MTWSEELFAVKTVKDTAPWTQMIKELNTAEIDGTFYEKKTSKY